MCMIIAFACSLKEVGTVEVDKQAGIVAVHCAVSSLHDNKQQHALIMCNPPACTLCFSRGVHKCKRVVCVYCTFPGLHCRKRVST